VFDIKCDFSIPLLKVRNKCVRRPENYPLRNMLTPVYMPWL